MSKKAPHGKVTCGDCGSSMELRKSRYGQFWGCSEYPKCTGTHGAHPDGRPLGIPANKKTREARIAAHAAFDPLWKGGRQSRRSAYLWLRHAMGMNHQPHIGEMTIAECNKVIAVCAQDPDPDPHNESPDHYDGDY